MSSRDWRLEGGLDARVALGRRRFLARAAAGISAGEVTFMGTARASATRSGELGSLGPIRQIEAGVLDVGDCDLGPSDGPRNSPTWHFDDATFERSAKAFDNGVVPATDGQATAAKFAGTGQHRVLANVGHNPPQEDPAAFATAVWDLASTGR